MVNGGRSMLLSTHDHINADAHGMARDRADGGTRHRDSSHEVSEREGRTKQAKATITSKAEGGAHEDGTRTRFKFAYVTWVARLCSIDGPQELATGSGNNDIDISWLR